MAVKIPLSMLIESCSSEQAYLKGNKLYQAHAVEELDIDDDEMFDDIIIEAEVQSSTGEEVYDVQLEYDPKRKEFTDIKWCIE